MGLLGNLLNTIKYSSKSIHMQDHEFCPRCEANLTLQKGYDNALPFWKCRGCGEMLINPDVPAEDDTVWICDGCGAMLNLQDGFSGNRGEWTCLECGFVNKTDVSQLYLSEDEYQESLDDPCKGLSDEAVLALMGCTEIRNLAGRTDIALVMNPDEKLLVRKILKKYDLRVFEYLKEHPVDGMPKLYGVYEGSNALVVLEEYIEGQTLSEILENGSLSQDRAVETAIRLCGILSRLHNLEQPIIHRDVKPSNVMITEDGRVYLLDINVARMYQPEKAEDTRLFGTLYYAAPEQFGYGFSSSSGKSDIYALGMLLNIMLTGKLPKEEKAADPVWPVIEKCIQFEPEMRYTADELAEALRGVKNR